MAKTKKVWKTKTVDNRRHMICQNSDLSMSKYSDWSPDNGDSKCENWSEVGANTDAVLCSECTQRSLQF